jgi:hypothetical protein
MVQWHSSVISSFQFPLVHPFYRGNIFFKHKYWRSVPRSEVVIVPALALDSLDLLNDQTVLLLSTFFIKPCPIHHATQRQNYLYLQLVSLWTGLNLGSLLCFFFTPIPQAQPLIPWLYHFYWKLRWAGHLLSSSCWIHGNSGYPHTRKQLDADGEIAKMQLRPLTQRCTIGLTA